LKNKEFIRFLELSTVGGSPGLNFLYISINASSSVSVKSFSRVFLTQSFLSYGPKMFSRSSLFLL